MLKIKVNGIALTLPADIKITFIIENPFMLADRIPTPYTLNFDLPASDLNLRLLNYPNRVTAFKRQEIASEIEFDNIVFSRGILKLVNFDKEIKLSYKGVSIFDDLTKKLFDLDLEKYEFGLASPTGSGRNKWNINRDDPNNFAGKYRKHNNDSFHSTKFAMAPVRVSAGSWVTYQKKINPFPGFPGSRELEFNIVMPANSADEMYLNFYNQRDRDFNVTESYALYSTTDASLEVYNTRAFPFPYVRYIFDKMFSDNLSNNPFSAGELSQLVLICPFHPKYYKISAYFQDEEFGGMIFDNSANKTTAFIPGYSLSSFMPDIAVNSLIKDILKTFCQSLYPDGDRFKIVSNKDVLNNPAVENWTGKIMGELAFGLREALNYKYGYDAINDEAVDVKPENKLNSIKDLVDKVLDQNTGYTVDFFIESTGEFYTKDVNDGETTYNRKNSGYGKSEEKSGENYDTSSNLSPLPMKVDEYWIQINADASKKPNRGNWYIPEYSGDRFTRPTSANIMFDRGLKPGFVADRQYPLLTAGNYDHFGNKLGDLSLAWSGDAGLINTHHKEFKAWIEKDKVTASGLFKLSATDLKMLDIAKKKNLKGKNFLIEKLQVTMSIDKIDPAQVDFVEA